MTDTNDFLEWLDAQDDPAEREASGWVCDSIERAEGAARRLREATDKAREIDAVADRVIAEANAWRAEASAPYVSKIERETRSLETFLRLQIEAGGPKSSPLPYGVTVKARKVGGTLEFPDGFADTAPDDVVRVKRSIDAKAAKARYKALDDGSVVDTVTGEVVEGVTVKPVEDRVQVTA